MTIDLQSLRIEGVYQQRQEGFLMQRVKLAAGMLSAEQARQLAAAADRFARGMLHLTTRSSIELHWLTVVTLPEVRRLMQEAGLTGRGACGGAVRGVSCSSSFAPGFPAARVLAHKLHSHFTGNPDFEGLPKKFKIAVEAGYESGRHLIQDLAVVCRDDGAGKLLHDLWVAGGLGREPQAAFLLEEAVSAEKVIPAAEALIRLYRAEAPTGKRLKHVVNVLGREEFSNRYHAMLSANISPSTGASPNGPASPSAGTSPHYLEAGVFAGELPAGALRRLADISERHAGGYLAVTHTQNVALFPAGDEEMRAAAEELRRAGFDSSRRAESVIFQVCPGSHECRLGLAPTRELAGDLLASLTPGGMRCSWAISGCPNSCSQPQLADFGIVTVKSVKEESGERTPRFDLYHREGEGLGKPLRSLLTREELLAEVAAID